MAKIERNSGRQRFAFVKELGGAIEHDAPSRTASILVERGLVNGRVLDFGCGHGFDADHFGWEAFDPHYRQTPLQGPFDTIVCNHVLNILTRKSRAKVLEDIGALLADDGVAFLSVSRRIPKRGKAGPRKRIQNHVVLTLPSLHADEDLEIYRMEAGTSFADETEEFEESLK